MALLADYAITPDVFDVMSYPSEDACEARLDLIREPMLTEGVVRDLRNGEWCSSFENRSRTWHRRGRELIRKLATQGRLIRFPSGLPAPPAGDREWCAEALDSHASRAFTGGIIVTETVKIAYAREPLVARIDRLGSARWWASRSSSVGLSRTLADHTRHLDPVFRCSNSLMFIDPHLDPMQGRYREFGRLVETVGRRQPPPTIEIHRVCYHGSGPERQFPMTEEHDYFERRFRDGMSANLRAAGLHAEVFIWDDFHDRYLISNLVGVSLPNGFDTTRNPDSITRWTRLGRCDRDDVQREFDPASRRHALHKRFVIP